MIRLKPVKSHQKIKAIIVKIQRDKEILKILLKENSN